MDDNALGGAPAPAETNSAALTAETATQNSPISVQMPAVEPKPEKAPSGSEAVKAAIEKVAADKVAAADAKAKADSAEKAKAATEKRSEQPVVEAAAKTKTAPEQTADNGQSEGRKSRYDAPARFNDQGKTEWANTPESVQAEVHRTIKNIEEGYTKHKDAAERFERIREYDDIARSNGREGIHQTLKDVVEFEQTILRDPVAGFQKVAQHYGLDLNSLAAQITGQNPDKRLADAHSEIQTLRGQITQMQTAQQMPGFVDEFRTDHDRFDELQDDIAFFLKNMIKDGTAAQRLATAYELADRLKPATAAASPAAAASDPASSANPASPAPAPVNPAGQKSISGSPSSGVTSGGKKRVLSSSEAVKAAMASA